MSALVGTGNLCRGSRNDQKWTPDQGSLTRDFHYITAITKPQIDTLLHKKVFPMELFDTKSRK